MRRNPDDRPYLALILATCAAAGLLALWPRCAQADGIELRPVILTDGGGWVESKLPGWPWPFIARPSDGLGPWAPGDVLLVPVDTGGPREVSHCRASGDRTLGALCTPAIAAWGAEGVSVATPLQNAPPTARRRAAIFGPPKAKPGGS